MWRHPQYILDLFCDKRLLPLLCKMWVNKAFVGSSHGDAPKYVGEGVALCGTPGMLGGPYCKITSNYGRFGYFSG